MKIKNVIASEIIDSRATPTVMARVTLDSGSVGIASVPSGASTGRNEAFEKRDNDRSRYSGAGVLSAQDSVNEIIRPALVGINALDMREIDTIMLALDGSIKRSNLGANAILSVSLAVARAAASALGIPLYRYVGGSFCSRMPVPMMNILNGGAHASNNVDIQEFMIVPVGAESFCEAVRCGCEVYRALKGIIVDSGGCSGVGDEGGFAPDLKEDKEALELIISAIEKAGYRPGNDVMISLDIASSEWFSSGEYRMKKSGRVMSREALCDHISSLVSEYPILSVEDGMAEEDYEGWQLLTERLGKRTILVGDDLFVTDTKRIDDGARGKIANAALIKPNQIGTLTETAEAISCAHFHGYKTVMSHRSGETEDTTISDLAVGLGTHFIKCGAPARGERVAKYNRLMEIERELFSAEYGF